MSQAAAANHGEGKMGEEGRDGKAKRGDGEESGSVLSLVLIWSEDREGERDWALHATLHREVTTSPGGLGCRERGN